MRVLRRIFGPKREKANNEMQKKSYKEEPVLLSSYFLDYQMG
jgi:hypothetical protein